MHRYTRKQKLGETDKNVLEWSQKSTIKESKKERKKIIMRERERKKRGLKKLFISAVSTDCKRKKQTNRERQNARTHASTKQIRQEYNSRQRKREKEYEYNQKRNVSGRS